MQNTSAVAEPYLCLGCDVDCTMSEVRHAAVSTLVSAQHSTRRAPGPGFLSTRAVFSLPQPVPEPHNTSGTFYVKRLTSSEHRSKVASVHCFPGKANAGAGAGLVEGKCKEYRLSPSLCSVPLSPSTKHLASVCCLLLSTEMHSRLSTRP